MTRALGSASPKLRSAATAAAFASLYFVTAVLTDSLIGDAGVAVLWPASGVYLGVMLLAPHRAWPALVCAAGVGSLAAYLYGGSSLQVSVAFAVPSSAEGFLAALLVERIARKRFRLGGLRDLSALVVGGALVANALIALSAGAVAAQTFHASFPESWLRWWSADALGMLAVAPILTAAVRPGLAGPSRWWSGPRVAALGGLGAALVAMQLVAQGGVGDVYAVQAFLAVLLLGLLGLVISAGERGRLREELGRTRAGSAEELDEERRRVVQLTAELAARRAEVIEGGRGQERLAERLRDSERARERAERELGETRSALAAAREEQEALGRDLGLTVADRDRVQTELRESTRTVEGLKAELSAAAGDLARARANGRALEEELEKARAERRGLDEELESTCAELARVVEELAEAVAGRQRVEEELVGVRAEHARAGEELGRALYARKRLEEELRSARTEHGRTAEELVEAHSERQRAEEQLVEACSGRQRAEEQLAVVGERVEALERELERARSAHQDAELALDHARARFSERRESLERSLAEATERLARLEAQREDRPAELSSRYDERGTCLSASPEFARLLGYEPAELVGRPGAELLHPQDRPRLVRARSTRSQSTFQARLRRKAGDFVWVEVSLDPVWSSGGTRLVELQATIQRFPLAA